MLSEAGRSYDKTRVVSPYRTRQRFRYYQLPPVQADRPAPKLYQTLDANPRQQHDSFLLRHHKDITLNTNHSPQYDLPKPNSPRYSLSKTPLIRYIGPIRDEDYSQPLRENCDRRCAQANGVWEPQESNAGGESSAESRQELPLQALQSDKNASLTTIAPLDLSGKLPASVLQSTDHSLVKKRSKLPDPERQDEGEAAKEVKTERRRGVSFDSSVGHRYLAEVDSRERYPECYDIDKSNESLIRSSFKRPAVHVKFPLFRDSIATRHDRADPHWHLTLEQSDARLPEKDSAYHFAKYSLRKPNEVYSKYPFRQCMNLYALPKPNQ